MSGSNMRRSAALERAARRPARRAGRGRGGARSQAGSSSIVRCRWRSARASSSSEGAPSRLEEVLRVVDAGEREAAVRARDEHPARRDQHDPVARDDRDSDVLGSASRQPDQHSPIHRGVSRCDGMLADLACHARRRRAEADDRAEADPVPAPSASRRWPPTRKRHYGIDSYRLRDPKVIVEHYTVTSTFQQTFNTFAPDNPDSELHELPGTCAHYVIDRDGTIYQLVPRSIMCRHTVGLNYTAIGIEHVGSSDARDPATTAAAGRLAAAHALAALPLRHRRQQRDRPQREPVLAVPPRARRAPASTRRTAT